MAVSREVKASLRLEECGLENRNDTSYDAPRRYVVSSSNFAAEGEIYFTSKPSALEATLETMFKTNTVSRNTTTHIYGQSYGSSSNPALIRKQCAFLTRDPIYAVLLGEMKSLLMDVGKSVLGREPSEGFELFCDILDEIISPPKRKF